MNDFQLIRTALRNHAELCRRQTARRSMMGPNLAEARAAKRAEAKQAELLSRNLSSIITRMSNPHRTY